MYFLILKGMLYRCVHSLEFTDSDTLLLLLHTQPHRRLIFRPLDCLNFYILFVCYKLFLNSSVWLYKCRKSENNLPHKRRIKCYRTQRKVFGNAWHKPTQRQFQNLQEKVLPHQMFTRPMNYVLWLSQDRPQPVQQLARIWKRLRMVLTMQKVMIFCSHYWLLVKPRLVYSLLEDTQSPHLAFWIVLAFAFYIVLVKSYILVIF